MSVEVDVFMVISSVELYKHSYQFTKYAYINVNVFIYVKKKTNILFNSQITGK